jgi:hypothetical protein
MMSYADTHQLILSACLAHDDAAAGWQNEPANNSSLRRLAPIDWRSSVALRSGDGRRLTLRWLLLDARPSLAIDAAMRARIAVGAGNSLRSGRCVSAGCAASAAGAGQHHARLPRLDYVNPSS